MEWMQRSGRGGIDVTVAVAAETGNREPYVGFEASRFIDEAYDVCYRNARSVTARKIALEVGLSGEQLARWSGHPGS